MPELILSCVILLVTVVGVYVIAATCITYIIKYDNAALQTSIGSQCNLLNVSNVNALASFRERIISAFNLSDRFPSQSTVEIEEHLVESVDQWHNLINQKAIFEIIQDVPEIAFSFGCTDEVHDLLMFPFAKGMESTISKSEAISKFSTLAGALTIVFEDRRNRRRFLSVSKRKLKAYCRFIDKTIDSYDRPQTVQMLVESLIAMLFLGKISHTSFDNYISIVSKIPEHEFNLLLQWVGHKKYLLYVKTYRSINEVKQHTKLNADFFKHVLEPLSALQESHLPHGSGQSGEQVVFEDHVARWFIAMLLDINRRRQL